MRPVIFVKYYDKGSTHFGGHQVSDALGTRGVEADTRYAWELQGVRDSILVFIKTSRIHHLAAARLRGNILVLDVMDTLCFKRRIKNRLLYDGVIFRNERQRSDYAVGRALNELILQQADPRYRPNAADHSLRVGYFGVERSISLWNQIPGVDFFADDWFAQSVRYNCHLSIREPAREMLYKPGTKVATAAVCNANLITTRDSSALELLGEDYPYFTEPHLKGVLRTIDYARETFGGDAWNRGLEAMRRVRELTAFDRILDQYVDFFGRLEMRE